MSGHLWGTQPTADLSRACSSGTVEKGEVVRWEDSTEMHRVGQDMPEKARRASDTLCFFRASSSPVRPLGPPTPSPAPHIPCFVCSQKRSGYFPKSQCVNSTCSEVGGVQEGLLKTNVLLPLKKKRRATFCHLQQHGWTWRA